MDRTCKLYRTVKIVLLVTMLCALTYGYEQVHTLNAADATLEVETVDADNKIIYEREEVSKYRKNKKKYTAPRKEGYIFGGWYKEDNENEPLSKNVVSGKAYAKYVPEDVLSVLYQIVYSICVDLFANCHIYSTYKWINFLIMLLGVVLFAVGTGLYASASLGRGSYEAVTFALAEKNHWQIKFVRMALDILVVVTGVLLGGKFGVCTLITVIISGPIIQFVNAKAKQVLKI